MMVSTWRNASAATLTQVVEAITNAAMKLPNNMLAAVDVPLWTTAHDQDGNVVEALNLTTADLELHARLGIPPNLLTAALVRRVDDFEARQLLSVNARPGNFAGLEYAYLDPNTGCHVTSRVRRDHPPIKADGSPDGKYMSPYGDRRHLYFPPGVGALLKDVGVPVVFVEAEKSVLAISAAAERGARSMLAIGTGGCWGWHGRIGKTEDASGARVDVKGALCDFDHLDWLGRTVFILFDGNARSNGSVSAARHALARELERRGVRVRVIDLPVESGVNGPDDFVGRYGDQAFFDLLGTAAPLGVSLDDFYSYMPQHTFIFTPTGDVWPASSVNARIAPVRLVGPGGAPVLDESGEAMTIAASVWLDRHHAVEQMTWIPGEPTVIGDRLVAEGGWIARPGCHTFNQYRAPQLRLGDASQADRWLEHVAKVYPDDAGHLVQYLAYKVQHPGQKINHALVLGGVPGIGKDAILEPVKAAVGPWNFGEVSPAQLLGRFNGFLKSVILRVSEVRDLGATDRYVFYEHLKAYTAAPPDVLRVDEKHVREYQIWNVCGVILTTNHKTDGLYLPADDRRHYVAWSPRQPEDFDEPYWTNLWGWYAGSGASHVAAYLATFDLSAFNPKAPPPKTDAFWDIVSANRAPEDAELGDVLEALSIVTSDGRSRKPDAITLAMIAAQPEASADFAAWLRDRRNSRKIPSRMQSAGYVAVRNPAAANGLWSVHKHRTVIYGPCELSVGERIAAAEKLSREQ